MRSPETFDAYYVETRARLLHEAYALTGDAPAARAAVRDAFVVAWHHWRKVGAPRRPRRLRPARSPSAGRAVGTPPASGTVTSRWTPRSRTTLDALSKLTTRQRELLVLNGLSALSLTDIGRMVGLPRSDAERELQTATSQFALHRDVPTTEIAPAARTTSPSRWSRSAGPAPRWSAGPAPRDDARTP